MTHLKISQNSMDKVLNKDVMYGKVLLLVIWDIIRDCLEIKIESNNVII
jgi:hypothetical protein